MKKEYTFEVKVLITKADTAAVALEIARGIMTKAIHCALIRTSEGAGSIETTKLVGSRTILRKEKK